jgi:hypothetical protein
MTASKKSNKKKITVRPLGRSGLTSSILQPAAASALDEPTSSTTNHNTIQHNVSQDSRVHHHTAARDTAQSNATLHIASQPNNASPATKSKSSRPAHKATQSTQSKPTTPSHSTSQASAIHHSASHTNTTHYSMAAKAARNAGEFPHHAQLRINPELFDNIKSTIDSAILGGNYAISSASDFLREALREHANGKPLSALPHGNPKKSISIRFDDTLIAFWNELPKRIRNNVLERAARTKLQDYGHSNKR